ncbi:hypothetical protein J2129_001278 [Methanofollis sp. W23]|nr:hypothetical protein [Methanofollis sp. W23]
MIVLFAGVRAAPPGPHEKIGDGQQCPPCSR